MACKAYREEIQLRPFLTSALDVVQSSASSFGRFISGKEPQHTSKRRRVDLRAGRCGLAYLNIVPNAYYTVTFLRFSVLMEMKINTVSFQGCDTVLPVRQIAAFRRNILPLSSLCSEYIWCSHLWFYSCIAYTLVVSMGSILSP
jgi:hypothetical protein